MIKKGLRQRHFLHVVGYTRKKFDGVCDSIIRIAMRNKITCLETNAKKKRAVSSY